VSGESPVCRNAFPRKRLSHAALKTHLECVSKARIWPFRERWRCEIRGSRSPKGHD
jgi:hypothetical protein